MNAMYLILSVEGMSEDFFIFALVDFVAKNFWEEF